VTLWRDANQVGITVSDDGPGVPAEEHERIFERFARHDPAVLQLHAQSRPATWPSSRLGGKGLTNCPSTIN
jgi:signal transduction histidine kinase